MTNPPRLFYYAGKKINIFFKIAQEKKILYDIYNSGKFKKIFDFIIMR